MILTFIALWFNHIYSWNIPTWLKVGSAFVEMIIWYCLLERY